MDHVEVLTKGGLADGRGWVLDAFVVAWMLPNMLRRMFGEGALSAAFVPAYTRRLEHDPAGARDLLSSVVGGLVVFLGLANSFAGIVDQEAIGLDAVRPHAATEKKKEASPTRTP